MQNALKTADCIFRWGVVLPTCIILYAILVCFLPAMLLMAAAYSNTFAEIGIALKTIYIESPVHWLKLIIDGD